MSSFIVALDREIVPFSLFRSRISQTNLVVWRGASGNIHVWEDRCPHRSVRLSAGRNMGDFLEGAYHGWRFGEDGTVIFIPAEGGRARPEISVRVLSSIVTNGFVWASTVSVTPDVGFIGNPARPLHFACGAEEVSPWLDSQTARITPWGSDGCMVYATTNDPKLSHQSLSALRRQLEASA